MLDYRYHAELQEIMLDSRNPREADILAAGDRGEATSLIEPLLVGEDFRHRGPLTDLAVEFAAKAAGLRRPRTC